MFKKLFSFLKTKTGKRATWTILNSCMSLGVAFVTYLAADSVPIAMSVLPFAQAASQYFTKLLNSK